MDHKIKELEKQIRILKKENEILIKNSERDFLTGLYNRSGFFKRVSGIIEEYKKELRNKKFKFDRNKIVRNLSVIFSDFDELKKINDVYGHKAGDKALKTFGNFLSKNVRPIDYVCRWGGDEFVIALIDADCHQANLKITSILKKMEDLSIIVNGKKINLSASFGSASVEDNCSGDGESHLNVSFENLIKLADKRMYSHKKSSR